MRVPFVEKNGKKDTVDRCGCCSGEKNTDGKNIWESRARMEKKIVILANDTTYTYNLRREVLSRMIEDGYEVVVVGESQQFQKELKTIGCRLIGVKTCRRGTNPVSDFALLSQYIQILKKEKPSLVLSFNIKPNVYGGMACRLLGIRYMPNITGLGVALEYPGKMQRLTSILYKIGIANAECVFFQNRENQKFFEDRKMLGKKSRVCLLPGSGVNLLSNSPLEYPDGEKIHFLFVARVMKEKGIDLFLAAARKFHGENCVFEVVGGCDDANYLKILQEAQEQNVVVYHGLQKDMTPFYERCSCLLYPSYYPEGMSNVLLEAAASGRPVIAADRAGCRETVDDGVSGYIVPVNDEAAVLKAVEKFLSLSWEERRAMGLAGRAKVEREFDREIVVGMYMDELKRGVCCE